MLQRSIARCGFVHFLLFRISGPQLLENYGIAAPNFNFSIGSFH